jgi:hypothetical protein
MKFMQVMGEIISLKCEGYDDVQRIAGLQAEKYD